MFNKKELLNLFRYIKNYKLLLFFLHREIKKPYYSFEGSTQGQKSIVYGCVV